MEDRMQTHTALRIEGDLTSPGAQQWQGQVMSALAQRQEVELDLSGVTACDSAGVQLLLAAKELALQGRRYLRLVNHSPAVLDVFRLLDLGAWFGDPLPANWRSAA
jgi:anti-sigma B factor antagonist